MVESPMRQKTGKVHHYRISCQAILLKSTRRKSEEVDKITDMTYVSVNSWVKRYKGFSINGLETQSGRGRKRKLSKETDKESIIFRLNAPKSSIK